MVFSLLASSILLYFGQCYFSYLEVSWTVHLLMLSSVYITWLPSFLLPNNDKTRFSKSYVSNENKYPIFVFLLIEFVFLIGKINYAPIGSLEFEENYSHGVFAHLNNFLIVLTAYMICFSKKNLFVFFVIAIGLLLSFISGTKYHIIFIFLVYVIKCLYSPSKKTFLKIVIGCLMGVFTLFAINYLVNFFIRGTLDDRFIRFALNHFIKYVSGGFIGFSQILNGAHSWGRGFVFVDSIGVESTNVYTFFGSLFLHYGFFSFIILLVLSIAAHMFFYLFMYEKRPNMKNILFLMYSFFFATQMFLSFFSSYYRLSNYYEWFVFSFILYFFLKKNTWNCFFSFRRALCQ